MKNVFDIDEDPHIRQLFQRFSAMQDSCYNNQEFMDEADDKINEQSLRKKSEKRKIFYIEKIAQLMPGDDSNKQSYNYNDSNHHEKGRSPIGREQQLKRNRESAKSSRQRKKQYVTILQQKNQQNSKIIQQLNEKLRIVSLERDRLKQFNQDAKIHNFMANKIQAYAQLSSVVRNSQSDSKRISQQIVGMLKRFGAAGTDRVAAIRYYMNEIIQILMSDIHKYFLNSSSVLNQGFLSPKTHNIDMQIIEALKIDNQKLTEIMSKYKERFNREAGTFKVLTQEFYRIYQSIENQAKVIEHVFNQLCHQFKPKDLGQLILWFEENKFRRDVRKVRADWVNQLMYGEKIEGIKRKVIKLDK